MSKDLEKENELYRIRKTMNINKIIGTAVLPFMPLIGVINHNLSKVIDTNKFINSPEGENLTREYVNSIMNPINAKYDTIINYPDLTNAKTTDTYSYVVNKVQETANTLIENNLVKDGAESMYADLSNASLKLQSNQVNYYQDIMQNSNLADTINSTAISCGICGAIVSTIIFVGIPFASYSMLKNDYKRLEKELELTKEQ